MSCVSFFRLFALLYSTYLGKITSLTMWRIPLHASILKEMTSGISFPEFPAPFWKILFALFSQTVRVESLFAISISWPQRFFSPSLASTWFSRIWRSNSSRRVSLGHAYILLYWRSYRTRWKAASVGANTVKWVCRSLSLSSRPVSFSALQKISNEFVAHTIWSAQKEH